MKCTVVCAGLTKSRHYFTVDRLGRWSLKVCGILKKWDLKNEKVLYLYTLIKYCIKYLLHSTPIAKLVYVWHI